MRARSSVRRLALGALVIGTAACASVPPEPVPTMAPASPPPVETPVPAPEVPVAPTPAPIPTRDRSVIFIDEPEVPVSNDLVTASRAAKEQREKTPAATTRITNKNLKDYAGGSVTTARPTAPDARSAELDAAAAESREEEIWRERILDLRLRARRSRDEIQRLESESAALRRSFYVEDDPYVRDSRIKPAWDRSLDNLNQARRDADSLRLELARVLDEGRQAGAQPGWLREGLELENDLPPSDTSEPAAIEPPDAAEPREPNSPP